MRYRLVRELAADGVVVAVACRVLAVSTAGYYEWRERAPSARAVADQALSEQIVEIHAMSRGSYGAPRVHAELRLGQGVRCGRKRVARLMRSAGLHGIYRRRGRHARPAPAVHDDRVRRRFVADAPDRLWLTDITEHPTREGKVYCAAVLDVSSRRIVGWSIADHLRTELVVAFYERYREDGWGRKASELSMMVALVLYAYCKGERSSRQIERRCREDSALRVLTANQHPDHATTCRFRQQHEEARSGLFAEVLRLCAEAGLVRVGVVALDGTKLHANASRERNRTDADLEAEVRRILDEAERVDAEENARFGDARGDELSPGFRDREERLQRLHEARERLAALERERQEDYEQRLRSRAEKDRRGRRPEPSQPEQGAKVNVTDPDSRVVHDYHGYFQGYNVQAVTTRDQIIVAAEVSRQATDMHELQPMIEVMHRNLQAAHCGPARVLLADAGYYSEANVRQAGSAGPGLLLATRSDRNRRVGAPPPRGRIPAGLSVRERMDRKLGRSVAGVSTSSGAG